MRWMSRSAGTRFSTSGVTSSSGRARTDSIQAERLRRQADTPLTPHPVADRLRQRAATLAELADNHDRTRIAPADEEPA